MNSNLNSPIQPEPIKGDEIHLINPSMKEFRTTYLDDHNNSVEVILEPLATRAFPMAQGLVILKHLMNFILEEGGFSYKTDVNLELADIRKKCVLYE